MVDSNNKGEERPGAGHIATTVAVRQIKTRGSTAVFWVDEVQEIDGKRNRTLGWYKCRSPYNKAFIAALKIAIPNTERQWVPAPEKVWAVSPKWAGDFVSLAAAYFENILELDEDPVAIARSAVRPDIRAKVARIRGSLDEKSQAVRNLLDEFGPRKVEV